MPTLIELMPGDLALGRAGDQFKTLLGSCVSVILTDPMRTLAAMCHIVHVSPPNAANGDNAAYGEVALRAMFSRLQGAGAVPSLCDAYVFGGGNMFPQLFQKRHVGTCNVEWVFDFLEAHHIRIVDQSCGGNGYRKVSWTVGPTQPVAEIVFAEPGSNLNER